MTDRETVRVLARQILNGLEHGDAIAYETKDRAPLTEKLTALLEADVMTEEEIREQAKGMMDQAQEAQEAAGDEGDVDPDKLYQAAKRSIINRFHGEMIGGLYLKESPKKICQKVGSFLMNDDLVEEVFLSDEEIEEKTLNIVKGFNPENIA